MIRQKGVICRTLVFMVLLLLLAGHPAAQTEEVTLSAAYASPSGGRDTLVLTVDVAGAVRGLPVPIPGAVVPPATPVPEPGTLALVGLGLLGLAWGRKRRRAC